MLALQTNKAYHFLLVNCATYENGINTILTLQCIQAISMQFPNAQISFLLHSSMQDFLKNHPQIKHVFSIDKTHNLVLELKKAKIDISISFDSNRESIGKLFMAGVKTRIGIFSNIHSLLFNYKVKRLRGDSNKHEASYNLDLLKSIGSNHVTYPKIYLNISEKQEAQNYLEEKFSTDSLLYNGCIVIYPGNGLKNVGWSAKNFLTMADTLSIKYNVLIIGLPQEVDGYIAMLKNYDNLKLDNLLVFNKVSFSIRKILSIISVAKLFIANNNTLLHAAIALDVPTFGFFAHKGTLNARRYYPFSNNQKHIVFTPFGILNIKDLAHEEENNTNHGVNMDSISPDFIAEILNNKILSTYDILQSQIESKEQDNKEIDKHNTNAVTQND